MSELLQRVESLRAEMARGRYEFSENGEGTLYELVQIVGILIQQSAPPGAQPSGAESKRLEIRKETIIKQTSAGTVLIEEVSDHPDGKPLSRLVFRLEDDTKVYVYWDEIRQYIPKNDPESAPPVGDKLSLASLRAEIEETVHDMTNPNREQITIARVVGWMRSTLLILEDRLDPKP